MLRRAGRGALDCDLTMHAADDGCDVRRPGYPICAHELKLIAACFYCRGAMRRMRIVTSSDLDVDDSCMHLMICRRELGGSGRADGRSTQRRWCRCRIRTGAWRSSTNASAYGMAHMENYCVVEADGARCIRSRPSATSARELTAARAIRRPAVLTMSDRHQHAEVVPVLIHRRERREGIACDDAGPAGRGSAVLSADPRPESWNRRSV